MSMKTKGAGKPFGRIDGEIIPMVDEAALMIRQGEPRKALDVLTQLRAELQRDDGTVFRPIQFYRHQSDEGKRRDE